MMKRERCRSGEGLSKWESQSLCNHSDNTLRSRIEFHRWFAMPTQETDTEHRVEELQWVVCMGDFALLRNLLSRRRESFLWMLFGWADALLRGFGQVVFANNPISGILTITAFALTAPGCLVTGLGTGFLGLLLSLLTRDSVENGLTVYNPVLIGTVTYALTPGVYGNFDAFVILMTIVGTIFSVYLTRSLASGRFPCITVPFNLVETTLLLILTMQRDLSGFTDGAESNTAASYPEPFGLGDNETASGALDYDGLTSANSTVENLDWGLVFRGVVVSASQVYAVDSVAAGAVIYLAILIYSPTSAIFCLLGALTGCLVALGLNVPYDAVYAGLWGYNSLLTAAAFGGLFLVINGQTGAAAFVAIVFTTLFQYVIEPLMAKVGLSVLTVPFVVTAWLFFGLRDSVDGTFPAPISITFPESEFHNLSSARRGGVNLCTVEDGSDPENPASDGKKPSSDPVTEDLRAI